MQTNIYFFQTYILKIKMHSSLINNKNVFPYIKKFIYFSNKSNPTFLHYFQFILLPINLSCVTNVQLVKISVFIISKYI